MATENFLSRLDVGEVGRRGQGSGALNCGARLRLQFPLALILRGLLDRGGIAEERGWLTRLLAYSSG